MTKKANLIQRLTESSLYGRNSEFTAITMRLAADAAPTTPAPAPVAAPANQVTENDILTALKSKKFRGSMDPGLIGIIQAITYGYDTLKNYNIAEKEGRDPSSAIGLWSDARGKKMTLSGPQRVIAVLAHTKIVSPSVQQVLAPFSKIFDAYRKIYTTPEAVADLVQRPEILAKSVQEVCDKVIPIAQEVSAKRAAGQPQQGQPQATPGQPPNEQQMKEFWQGIENGISEGVKGANAAKAGLGDGIKKTKLDAISPSVKTDWQAILTKVGVAGNYDNCLNASVELGKFYALVASELAARTHGDPAVVKNLNAKATISMKAVETFFNGTNLAKGRWRLLFKNSIQKDLDTWYNDNQVGSNLDPKIASDIYKTLRPMLVEAISGAGQSVGGNAMQFANAVCQHLEDPVTINQLYSGAQRNNWLTYFKGGQFMPAATTGTAMAAIMLINRLRATSDVQIAEAAKYLFDQIRSEKYYDQTAQKPAGVNAFPPSNENTLGDQQGQQQEQQQGQQQEQQQQANWETPAAHWLTPEVVGLASSILHLLVKNASANRYRHF